MTNPVNFVSLGRKKMPNVDPCKCCKTKKCKGCPYNPSVRPQKGGIVKSGIILKPLDVTIQISYSGNDPKIDKMCEDINKALERRRNGYVIKGKIEKVYGKLPIKPKAKFSRRKARKGRKD